MTEAPKEVILNIGTPLKADFNPQQQVVSPGIVQSPKAAIPTIPGVDAGARVAEPLPSPEQLAPASSFTFPEQPTALTAGTEATIRDEVNLLAQNLTNTEIVGQQLRKILVDLQQNPATADFLADADWGLMVRALRVNYGRAVAIKKTNKRKKKPTAPLPAETTESIAALGAKLRGLKL